MTVQEQTNSIVPLFTSDDKHARLQTQRSLSKLLAFFCWNVANPSLRRAQMQAPWLLLQPADVLILSECKNSRGCQFLEAYLRDHGYQVVFPTPEGNEYGVLIASKYRIDAIEWSSSANHLRSRVVCVSLRHPSLRANLEIIGIYVPSRDQIYEKRERKRRFIHRLLAVLDERANHPYRVCCGDFNVVEPNHIPRYGSIFRDWEYGFYRELTDCDLRDVFRHLNPEACEYSWVGRTGDGYRYDHCFVSTDLLPLVRTCHYLHTPREARLSDHSALVMQLSMESS
jgi:exodeoxyribonuclease-3